MQRAGESRKAARLIPRGPLRAPAIYVLELYACGYGCRAAVGMNGGEPFCGRSYGPGNEAKPIRPFIDQSLQFPFGVLHGCYHFLKK